MEPSPKLHIGRKRRQNPLYQWTVLGQLPRTPSHAANFVLLARQPQANSALNRSSEMATLILTGAEDIQ
jgi:hypothetical protein